MPDKFSADIRSGIMSKIRSKWTKPEMKMHGLLKGNKIRHLMHPDLKGNPDAYLKDFNAVLFIDGCFWHNCPKHGHMPKKNSEYWVPKIIRNTERDKRNTRLLESEGFRVIRLWECDIMKKDFKWVEIRKRINPKQQKK
jgi:DNA mismatch endonuclease (patch repair protein)